MVVIRGTVGCVICGKWMAADDRIPSKAGPAHFLCALAATANKEDTMDDEKTERIPAETMRELANVAEPAPDPRRREVVRPSGMRAMVRRPVGWQDMDAYNGVDDR